MVVLEGRNTSRLLDRGKEYILFELESVLVYDLS